MNTLWLLMARYDGIPIIPADIVARDFFTHLDGGAFCRKAIAGDIRIPIVTMEDSVKSARGVHIADLAKYLDGRAAAGRIEAAKVSKGVSA